ncbi:hypothetical protein LJK88_49610 [Paenibacillus sp. P26]|nr:hypothetical protein LJK88_49610 [Paenibacillus sp. P26]UUZ91499.1 hypothetical protein LJK87_38735 [Paenibacillus sp. P25]
MEAEFAVGLKHFSEMPNQTQEEADAVAAEGQKLKKLDLEIEQLRRESDPDDELHFENQLGSYILGMKDGVVELKERAAREQNPVYLKQAEAVQQKIARFEKEMESYRKKERTVRRLRKELNLPSN